jgi:MFS family permease
MLLGGGAGDHFGRRRLFLIGITVFTLASILCATAPSLGWLLVARCGQGLGAALLMPNSLALLGSAFTGEARGRDWHGPQRQRWPARRTTCRRLARRHDRAYDLH